MAGGLHVVAPALPGFGGTAKLPDERCSIAGFADWLVELLDELGIGEPVLVMGHSFGGGVAIAVAHVGLIGELESGLPVPRRQRVVVGRRSA